MTATTAISAEAPLVTLINVFTVDPQRQDELVIALDQSTSELFTTIPGFLSANLHASQDGTRVVNYAQWSSVEAFQSMLAMPQAQEHMKKVMTIADAADPRLYTVRSVHHPAHERA
jgi:heme-degrading monooxygenase HmoA